MSIQSPSKTSPFFSLLIQNEVIFEPYKRTGVEKFFTEFVSFVEKRGWPYTTLTYALKTSFFVPALLCLSFFTLSLPWMIAGGLLGVTALIWGAGQLSMLRTIENEFRWKSAFEKDAPTIPHPYFKTQEVTFSQCYSFAVKDNHIWVAPRISPFQNPEWKPFYFEDLPTEGIKSIQLRADGQNLMAKVHTEKGAAIYYKKCMEDERKDGQYIVHDMMDAPFSDKQWFTLPFVHWISVKQWHQRLQLDPLTFWTMSHTGALRHLIHDSSHREHEIWGTTTVYEIQGHEIVLYDPYVPRGLEIRISIPPNFTLFDIQASSSRLFLFGETIGDPKEKVLYMISALDYDVLGLNPMMAYSKDKDQQTKRMLPMSCLEKIELPKGELGTSLTVIQTGPKDEAELRIEAFIGGELGFYFKKLREETWLSYVDQHPMDIIRFDAKPHKTKSFYSKPHLIKKENFTAVTLDHFDPNALHPEIILSKPTGEKVRFLLHRETNMITGFIKGAADYHWELSLAPDCQTPELKQWFGGVTQGVKIQQEGDSLHIIGHDFDINLIQLDAQKLNMAHKDKEDSWNVDQSERKLKL